MPANASMRDKAIKTISRLPKKRLKEVIDFAEYLEKKEETEATAEILADKKLLDAIKAGIEDLRAGRLKPWRAVRKNV